MGELREGWNEWSTPFNWPTHHLPPCNQSRRLVMDVFSYPPNDPLEREKFLGVQLRFEKLIHYIKYYIKREQEKKVYINPRQHEIDRLEYIDEALSNPYMGKSDASIMLRDREKFDCRASEFQSRFLFDTLITTCKSQDMRPDHNCQLAQDVARFYQKIFIPEGGVPRLQQSTLAYRFLWVCAAVEWEGVMFWHYWIDLNLTSPKDNNCSNPDSDPAICIQWTVNTIKRPYNQLVGFERFYDERANGFNRQKEDYSDPLQTMLTPAQKSQSQKPITQLEKDKEIKEPKVADKELVQIGLLEELKELKEAGGGCATEKEKEQAVEPRVDEFQESGNVKDFGVAEEELVRVGTVDKLGESKEVEREGSAEKEKGQAMELRMDEFQETGDAEEFEAKEKEPAKEPVDKLQEKGDKEMEDYEAKQEELAVERTVGKLQGTRTINLKVNKTDSAVKPKVGKLQETEGMEIDAQEDIQNGRKMRKLRKGKGKAGPQHSETPGANIKSDTDNTNQPTRGKSKARSKQNESRKKKRQRSEGHNKKTECQRV